MKLLTKKLLTQLEQLRITSRTRLRLNRKGERASLRKGSSIEFSDYREYLPGDDIRSIDWNVFARTEKLFLKLFLEDESKPVYFVVDSSRSMNFGDPTKFEYAAAFACALSYVCLMNYDNPRILVVRHENHKIFSISSLSHFFNVVRQIESIETAGETHWSASLRKIALLNLPRGIYFLISDFYSPDGWDGMKLLAALGNELHCFQTLTPEEIEPKMRGDLRLIDSETDVHAEVSINPSVLKRYNARLLQMQESLKQSAFHSLATYTILQTTTPLEQLVLRDLRKKAIVR